MIPCHGVYADVNHVQGLNFAGENNKQFQLALTEYEKFKNGGEIQVKFPGSLASKKILENRIYYL